MDLFDVLNENNQSLKPLAERMRAETLDEFIGQEHIVGKNSLLRRAISVDKLGNCIFYGPPGTGKTTLAFIISKMTKSNCVKLNAVLSGVADAKKIIDEAKENFRLYGKKTYLILDECHRWNKAQSDSLLAPIEQGFIIFIGTTTENPYVSLTRAIISRCRVFEFKKLSDLEIKNALQKSISSKKGFADYNVKIDDEALSHISLFSAGDLRTAYNALELAVITTNPDNNGVIHIDKDVAEQSIQKKALSIDESLYYDMLSAFCKSLRGSDSDAALYWSERLISAGLDPMIIARRLIAHSAEDVGMADPNALLMAMAALQSIEKLGLPECRIPLTEAIIYVCEASKSNSVVVALNSANECATKTKDDNVPSYLLDTNYKGFKVTGYKYPHNYGGWVEQDYLPKSIREERFYKPLKNGFEGKLIRAKDIKNNKG